MNHFVLRASGIAEKVIATILLVGLIFGCVRLGVQVRDFSAKDLSAYLENLLVMAFNIIIVLEFIRMLVKHSMHTTIEVLIFAVARGLVIGHEKPAQMLISILTMAILLICRKNFFHEFDFKEEG